MSDYATPYDLAADQYANGDYDTHVGQTAGPDGTEHLEETRMDTINANLASHLIGDWFDTLPGTCEERADLDIALDQNAWLWDSNRARRCERTRPLAVLRTVDRLRHWQAVSAAPGDVREAMGVMARHLRDRAGVVYDADLLDEVDRLRAELADARS